MKKFILLLIGATLYAIGSFAQTTTDLSSNFSSNTTLTAANSPYLVTNSIGIDPDVVVTIEKGVEIRFNSGTYLHVRGKLNAKGTKFTANGSTAKGFWDGIYVSYEYYETGSVTLDSCTVEYASNLYARNGQLTLKNFCTLNNFSGYGVQISSKGSLYLENTTIKNTNFPIYFYGAGELKAGPNVQLNGNVNDYILLQFSDIPGKFYMPNLGIPYYCNYLNVTPTGTLNISAGVELKMMNCEMTIQGKIKALGTIEKPIIFDNHPSSSYFLGINITDSSNDTACVFNNCIIKNVNYQWNDGYVAMEINNASPTFNRCNFTGNWRNLLVTGISKPTFTNCNFGASTILNSECYNIGIDLNTNIDFSTDTIKFNNNEIRALKIIPSTVVGKANLKKTSFKNLDNISYCLYGQTTVHDTASLVIDPGIVIKCRDYSSYIYANGTLTGIGTETEPIIFTHIADDNFGNPRDSQNDGVQGISHSNSGRIFLYGKTNTSKIENWKIQYGGYDQNNWSVYVSNNNVVKNCEIKNSYRGIWFATNAQVLNNSFLNIDYYPVGRHVNKGNPVLIGNSVSNVGYIGIAITDFADDSPTLNQMDFAGFTNVAYIVENMQTIAAGSVLSIDPGVVIKFQDYYGGFIVNGAIKAIGKADNKIIFTSVKDDSAAGDSNNNGTANVPAAGNWYGINFSGTASDTENILKNCELRYSGSSNYINYPDDYSKAGVLRINDCHVLMDSIKVNFCSNSAIGIFGNANPEITNSQLYNIGNAPVFMDMFANPSFNGIKIANAPRIGLLIRGQEIKGTIPVRIFEGHDTITYIMEQNMSVTDQLTIPAGLTFKGPAQWHIRGKLDIQGTAQKPVVFTTQEDDLYGNPKDLQQNGNTAPTNNGGIFVFYDESNDLSSINHAIFRYSSAIPINLTNASPKILNTTFENLSFSGISLAGSSKPTINGCTFNNISFPFTTSLVTYPAETTGNTISGSTGRAIRVTDETLTQDVTLLKRDFGGITNIPYVFLNYTVGTGAKLTVNPGIVCKFGQNGYLNIQNGLIAKGGSTQDSTIVFTSDRDDFYGGDTYNDGDSNLPTNNSWQGIYFLNESIDENCILENCIFKNSSNVYYPDYDWGRPSCRGAVTFDNASPSLKNCLFENNYYGIIARNTSLPKIISCDFVGTDQTNGYGVWNMTATNTVTATNCWWNSNTGPRHASNPGGLGERVSDYVVFTPFAQQLAKPVLGDVSMNGEVKPYDASLILQYTVMNTVLTPKQLGVADVSGNGVISAYDASLILQYSVGLISRFNPDGKKSGAIGENALITYPDMINEPVKKTFEIPLALTTSKGIKALDMKYSMNQNHIKFIGVTKGKFPSGIALETGTNLNKGELLISMASAYDLGLNNDTLVLKFEFVDSNIKESQFSLTSATGNDDNLIVNNRSVLITNAIISAVSNVQLNTNQPIVYSDLSGIHIQIRLLEANQNLNIRLVDVLGRVICTRTIANMGSDKQEIDLLNSETGHLKPGVYILNFKAGDFFCSRKLLIK